jgi:hypothetical protein
MAWFTVDTHLFRELGEFLVGRDSTALIELVKNSFDADATEVEVHAQHLERDNPPFPRSLPVRRLPTIVVTPPAAVEFFLAEMFESRWQKHAAAETADMQRWKPIQNRRLLSLFEWQKRRIQGCIGSPWTAVKSYKPDADLFLRAG